MSNNATCGKKPGNDQKSEKPGNDKNLRMTKNLGTTKCANRAPAQTPYPLVLRLDERGGRHGGRRIEKRRFLPLQKVDKAAALGLGLGERLRIHARRQRRGGGGTRRGTRTRRGRGGL
jgi:hypothetical protein